MILILDIGKTNKKCFVFDKDYRIVFEQTTQLPETTDEDGDPCEDLDLLQTWALDAVLGILAQPQLNIKAINVTAYGASFVCLDDAKRPLTPLYNYLKPYPEDLKKQFFDACGGEEKIALETASPVLGSLNSGLQLYRLNYRRPALFDRIKYALHLPQFIASLISKACFSEITSIGCHTMLWDFRKQDYHTWVKSGRLQEKFPPIKPSTHTVPVDIPAAIGSRFHSFHAGPGLHDSSAALIPYLAYFKEPFVLISTGTWCISLNPFNEEPLTEEELRQDCLCYLTFEGKSVKAARYFGGHEHEQAVKALAATNGVGEDFYKKTTPDCTPLMNAYETFMHQLMEKQVASTRLAIGNTHVRRIFVDGGFSQNELYMDLLAAAFPDKEVFAAETAQATALGAALAIHSAWNDQPLPNQLISLKKHPL
jgi:sugar (pentulose or hexulose) kinase